MKQKKENEKKYIKIIIKKSGIKYNRGNIEQIIESDKPRIELKKVKKYYEQFKMQLGT